MFLKIILLSLNFCCFLPKKLLAEVLNFSSFCQDFESQIISKIKLLFFFIKNYFGIFFFFVVWKKILLVAIIIFSKLSLVIILDWEWLVEKKEDFLIVLFSQFQKYSFCLHFLNFAQNLKKYFSLLFLLFFVFCFSHKFELNSSFFWWHSHSLFTDSFDNLLSPWLLKVFWK